LILALAGTVFVDEFVELGTKQGHKGSAGPGPVDRISLGK